MFHQELQKLHSSYMYTQILQFKNIYNMIYNDVF